MPGVDGGAAALKLDITPADEEAVRLEQTLLGGLLCNPGAVEFLPPGFGAQHFAGEDHGDIFAAIGIAAATGATVILPLVREALPEASQYVASLLSAMLSGRAEDLRGYAASVMEAAVRRSLLALADGIKHEVSSSGALRQPLPTLLAKATGELERIAAGQRTGSPSRTLDEAMDEALRASEEAAARGDALVGLTSGFDCIDRRLGGLIGGGVYVLGARPGMGKSSLALQIGMRAAKAGAPVLFVSLEMSACQVGMRALALASRLEFTDISRGLYTRDTWKAGAVVAGRQRMSGLPLSIEDEGSQSVSAISLRVKRARRRWGNIGLVIVDHLHIVGRPESAGKFGETQALTEISMGIKRIAKEFDVPVLLLAQLNRAVEGRDDKRPQLSDLRGSGSIEQDAEAVMFLYRPDYYTEARNGGEAKRPGESDAAHAARLSQEAQESRDMAGKAELIFDKVRDGERGTDILSFDAVRMRFHEEGEA